MNESHIIGSGGKRIRKGNYKCVYLDNHGKDKRGVTRYGWRGEIHAITPGGDVRLRAWFKTREDAQAWVDGK